MHLQIIGGVDLPVPPHLTITLSILQPHRGPA